MRSRQASIDVEQIRRKGLYEFAKRAWSQVETMPYVDNWHIEEKCIHLEAVAHREIRDLLINEPPGCSKSLIVSVLFPVWCWLPEVRPELRFIYGSFEPSLALRDAEKAYKLLTSPWFTERWGNFLPADEGKPAMGDYANRFGGFRFSTSVGGKGTGRHCHVRVADDPLKPLDVESTTKAVGAAIEKVDQWWRGTMASRRADPTDFASIVCMQRLHELDLSSICKSDGYTHLCFPMRFVSNLKCVTKWGGDRRSTEGELLNPRRMPEEAVAAQEKSMGGKDGPIASAQLQQSPAPPGGLIFKEETFQHFTLREAPFIKAFSCMSVDCAFKDAEANSGVGIEVWGMTDARFHCYHSVLDSLGFFATIDAIAAVLAMYPETNAILVEDKANGSAVIEILQKKFPQVIPMSPKTSKLARAHAANVYYQARSVYHLADAEWLGRKETNLKHFPKGRRVDDVDCTSQALVWIAAQSMADFSAAMRAAKQQEKDGTWSSQLAQHFLVG